MFLYSKKHFKVARNDPLSYANTAHRRQIILILFSEQPEQINKFFMLVSRGLCYSYLRSIDTDDTICGTIAVIVK